jgi:peptidoglycan/xylan/chitin deacetylase (PgdA/CDA1 family)
MKSSIKTKILLLGLLMTSGNVFAQGDDLLQPVKHTFADGAEVEIVKCYPDGRMRAYCVSFDDGTLDSDKYILETLRRRNMKATFFINTLHEKSREAMLQPEYYKGFEAASHGANHKGFGKMPLDVARKEIQDDQTNIKNRFGQEVKGFAYPYGDIPKELSELEALEDMMSGLGIIYARGVRASELFVPPSDFMRWEPDAPLGKDMMRDWNKYLNQPADKSVRVLMQFAHSIDYIRGHIPMDVWEEYLDIIAANKDVWNPDMIEFTRYIMALRTLKFTEKGIENKSGISVWIKVNDKVINIKSGKSIKWKNLK